MNRKYAFVLALAMMTAPAFAEAPRTTTTSQSGTHMRQQGYHDRGPHIHDRAPRGRYQA